MKPVDIELLRKLEAEATKGPWRASDQIGDAQGAPAVYSPLRGAKPSLRLVAVMADRGQFWTDLTMREMRANKALIIATRNALPALLALVEAQTDDLLTTEWTGWVDYVGDGGYDCCPVCKGVAPDPDEDYYRDAREELAKGTNVLGHKPGCARDVLLTTAGLATQAQRDAKRAEIAKRREEKK